MCSSHEEQTVEFTDNPYKAGMCVHHTKNYQRGLLRLIEFEARGSVSMDREERLMLAYLVQARPTMLLASV